jgi:beta-galactosidase/beta-glucuronidase
VGSHVALTRIDDIALVITNRREGIMNRYVSIWVVAVCAASATLSFASDVSPRKQQCLNGVWEFSPGTLSDTKPADDAHWVAMPVPSFWDRPVQFGVKATWPDDLACGWYRRTFTMPNDWPSRRIVLRFDAVRYACDVFVNDRRVAQSVDGFIGFSVDITDAVNRAGPNQLRVKVMNWRALLADDRRDINMPIGETVTGTYAFLGPIGPTPRCGNMAGIWQDVWLETLPTLHIQRVKIDTDV